MRLIPHTIVYSNTEKPYSEWTPAYVIVGVWEGSSAQTPWIPYDIWQLAQREAERLICYFHQEKGKFGQHMIRAARWRMDICDAILFCVRASGFQAEVRYPPFEEDHCRQFTLKR